MRDGWLIVPVGLVIVAVGVEFFVSDPGQTDPAILAALAHQRFRATKVELEAPLRGRGTLHHRFMLQLHLDHLDAVNKAFAGIDFDNRDKSKQALRLVNRLQNLGYNIQIKSVAA